MTTLNLGDLSLSQALDRKSMAELRGGAQRQLRSCLVASGARRGYSYVSGQYQGPTVHDNSLSRHTYETWKRTRTQTEYSYWDHFVKL